MRDTVNCHLKLIEQVKARMFLILDNFLHKINLKAWIESKVSTGFAPRSCTGLRPLPEDCAGLRVPPGHTQRTLQSPHGANTNIRYSQQTNVPQWESPRGTSSNRLSTDSRRGLPHGHQSDPVVAAHQS